MMNGKDGNLTTIAGECCRIGLYVWLWTYIPVLIIMLLLVFIEISVGFFFRKGIYINCYIGRLFDCTIFDGPCG